MTLLFCYPEANQVVVLKIILYCFELASGLKINFAKSAMIYVRRDQVKKRTKGALIILWRIFHSSILDYLSWINYQQKEAI